MDYKKTLMYKEICETPEVLQRIKKLNGSKIEALAAEIKKRGVKNAILSGRGTSDNALLYFKYALEIMTPYTAGLASPSEITVYGGKVDYSKSFVIGCSQSGCAKDVIAVIESAKAKGSITVAVTNDDNSPLAKAADVCLFLGAGEEKSVAATKTFSAQLYTLLCLAAALADDGTLYASLDTLGQRFSGYIEEAEIMSDKAHKLFTNAAGGFSLARGITLAAAFESALKLQETSRVRIFGYAYSDFYHGPMEMVDSGMPIIFYAPKFRGKEEFREFRLNDQKAGIDKMLSLGADVILVTEDGILTEYDDKAVICRFKDTENEFFSMFAFTAFFQLLALKTSCSKGLNPDAPKALKKITITK